jgi:Zn-dependent protease
MFGGFSEVEPAPLRYLLSLSAAILLFICILLHELGHSYVALKYGSNIQSITLFLFGGVSSMEEIPRDPKAEFQMALAGPATSLVIGTVLVVIFMLYNPDVLQPVDNPYMLLVWQIGSINILLGIFNLLPAFPMDGGRLLRAWLATQMSYIKATQAAASIGKMFAIFMGIFGLFYSIWLTLIAFFIYIGASEEEKLTAVSVILEGIRAKDIMSKDIITVNPDMTVEELVEVMFKFKHMGYPVVDNGVLQGIVTFTDVQKVPKEERKNVRVSQIMTKDIISIKEDDGAVKALRTMTVKNI